MAWLDDRVWAHPKFADLTPLGFRAYVYGVCYSSGFGTRGRLTPGTLKTIHVGAKQRDELITAGLWNVDNHDVVINDWDEHNGKRDQRRANDRERKRKARASAGQDADKPPDSPQDTTRTRRGQVAENNADRRALKEVKEVTDDGSKSSDVSVGSTQPPDLKLITPRFKEIV